MIILLDTSTPVCRLTIIRDGHWHNREWRADRTLARYILQFLRDNLEEFGGLEAIESIGIMRGPGSFTGLRIGLTVMNTLAYELQVPIVGASGELWRDDAVRRLQRGEDDRIVLPEYGGEAHITRPKR